MKYLIEKGANHIESALTKAAENGNLSKLSKIETNLE